MAGIGIGLALAPHRMRAARERSFRIFPVSETSAFVIAPHEMGAIGYELGYQNGSSTETPTSSIGTPFGGWRWRGTNHLRDVEDDPTSPLATLHSDIGSVDCAMQGNFGPGIFGGHYHGGIVINSSSMPDLSTARYVSSFSFGYDATITWPTGQTANVVYEMDIQPDGNLAGSISYTSTVAFYSVYLSMMIGNGFTHYSTDGGETFEDGRGTANYNIGSATSCILRQSTTGYEIEIGSDQIDINAGGLTNSVINNGSDRLKHYVYKSTQGAALGTLGMSRTIAFRKTDPDPMPGFDPITDTFDGAGSIPDAYIRTHTGAGTTTTSVLNAGAWEIRAGSAPVGANRWVRPLTGAVTDGETLYGIEIDYSTVTAATSLVVYVLKDASGSTSSGNLLPFNGESTSLNLNSSSVTAATMTLTLPTGTAPHLCFTAADIAGRGVNITEVRITQM